MSTIVSKSDRTAARALVWIAAAAWFWPIVALVAVAALIVSADTSQSEATQLRLKLDSLQNQRVLESAQ